MKDFIISVLESTVGTALALFIFYLIRCNKEETLKESFENFRDYTKETLTKIYNTISRK